MRLIIPIIVSILFIFCTTFFAYSDQSGTLDSSTQAVNATTGPGLSNISLSPNVEMGFCTNATNYAITSLNSQAAGSGNGIEYGMVNTKSSYYQHDSSSLTTPNNADGNGTVTTWEPMGN